MNVIRRDYCYRLSLDLTGLTAFELFFFSAFHRVLMSAPRFYWVLMSVTRFEWVLPNFPSFLLRFPCVLTSAVGF